MLAISTNNEVNSKPRADGEISLGCEVVGEPDEDDRDSRSCCDVRIEEDTVGVGVIVLAPATKECPCCTTTHFTEMYVMQVQYFGDERVDWFACSRKSYLICIGIPQMKD